MNSKKMLIIGVLSGVIGAVILNEVESTASVIIGGILLVGGMISIFLSVVSNRSQK